MFNRRILISTAAVCALSAAVAGGAVAAPDHEDGPVSPTQLAEGVESPAPVAPTGISADELALFQQRAHRTAVDCDASSPGQKALDREYELAGYVRGPAGTTAPAWFDALYARSDALNQTYSLGAYAKLQH